MNNGQIMRIYPEMQEKRLLDLIHNVTPELEQLRLLREQHTILSRISEEERDKIIDDFKHAISWIGYCGEALSTFLQLEPNKRERYFPVIDRERYPLTTDTERERHFSYRELNTVIDILIKVAKDIGPLKDNILNFRKIPSSIYDEYNDYCILEEEIIEQQKEEIKTIFDELIKSNPKQSNLLEFVSDQELKPIEGIVKTRMKIRNKYLNFGNHEILHPIFSKTKLLEFLYRMEIEQQIISKFDTAIDLKPKELPVLKNKLLKVRTQIYNNQVKERRLLRAITPNIVIRELPFYDISEEHCCFEYHINDKSLFLDKFKIKNSNDRLGQCECTSLKRSRIEGFSINNVSELHEHIKEFIDFNRLECFNRLNLDLTYSLFFKKKRIEKTLPETILHDNELMNKYSYGDFVLNHDCFIAGGNIVGFIAITTVRDDKSFDKIMYFQHIVSTKGKPYLHVVECCELPDNVEVSNRGEKITYDHTTKRNYFLKKLNDWLYPLLFSYEGEKEPSEIIKSGELFKVVDEGSEIKHHDEKPYDKYLNMIIEPLKMEDQSEKAENDIIKKYIEKFMDVSNILKNIHAAGSPTNTLLRMPYCCTDGLKIANNLPITKINYNTAIPKIINDENGEDIDKLMKANREAINKLVDKSLEEKQEEQHF